MSRITNFAALSALVALPFACTRTETAPAPAPAPAVAPVAVVDEPAPAPVVAEVIETPTEVPLEDPTPRSLFEEEALFVEGDATSHRELAKTLLSEGKPGEAIESFRRVLFVEPTAEAWSELGHAYLKADEESRGLACLEEAVKLNRFRFDDQVEMAKRYLERGELEKARHHAGLVALNRVDDVEAQYLAGRAFMKSNMWREAMNAFEVVVQVEPDNKFARNNLGYAALQIGEDHLALRHLEETLDLEPTPYMMNNLGLAYERLTQHIDAYAAYMAAVDMKPGYVKAIVNRDRIKQSLTDEEKQLAMDIVEELTTPRVPTAVAAADDEMELGE